MARRRTRRKTRSRRTRGINLLNAAEMYLQTNVLTQGFAGVNPISFITGQEMGQTSSMMSGTNQKTGQPFSYAVQSSALGYYPGAISVTIPELLGVGAANVGDGINTLVNNGKANWLNMMIGTIGVRAGFAVAKKITSKQRSFINNQVMKPLGLKSMVRV